VLWLAGILPAVCSFFSFVFLHYYAAEYRCLWKLGSPGPRALFRTLGPFSLSFIVAISTLVAGYRLFARGLGALGGAVAEAAVFLVGLSIIIITGAMGERLAIKRLQRMREERRREEEEESREEEIRELRSKLGEARREGEGLRRRVEELERLLEEKDRELEELRRARGIPQRPSPQQLARMAAEGWKFGVARSGGKEYLRARRTAGGRREERSLGPLDEGMREALRAAGISLGGRADAGG